jgi:hypothetical protein
MRGDAADSSVAEACGVGNAAAADAAMTKATLMVRVFVGFFVERLHRLGGRPRSTNPTARSRREPTTTTKSSGEMTRRRTGSV